MGLFAIGDLHFGFAVSKPMDIFGENWKNHSEKIIENVGGYFDMHIVSKMGDKIPSKYPDIKIGNLTLKEIHDLTRKAIKETEDLITEEGHNPYI